jgi:hypothetical protein
MDLDNNLMNTKWHTTDTTPPRNNLTQMNIRLIDARMAPASVLHLSWNQPGKNTIN